MKKSRITVAGPGWRKYLPVVEVDKRYVIIDKRYLISLLEFLGRDAEFGGGFYVVRGSGSYTIKVGGRK